MLCRCLRRKSHLAILGVVVVMLGLAGACEPGWRAPDATQTLAPSPTPSPAPSPTVTPSTAAQAPAVGSTIAFLDAPDGNSNIFLIRPDGSNRTQLTYHDNVDGEFSWSPDAKKIVFVSDTAGDLDIYTVDVETGAETRLTSDGADEIHPVWSPDGQTIAFVSGRTGAWKIYLMDADGTNQRRLTTDATDRSEAFPSWSPDGKRIAFSVGDLLPDKVINVVNRDGSEEKTLTAQLVRADHPLWSPAGQYIAFTTNMDFVDGTPVETRVGLVRPDGTGLSILKVGKESDWYPEWSPDGRQLALAAYGSVGGGVIVVLDVASQQKKVLTSPVHTWGRSWAPGGDKIAYMPTSKTKQGIWIIGVDRSGDHQLVEWGTSPAWSPFWR